jgi:hypothetical protein
MPSSRSDEEPNFTPPARKPIIFRSHSKHPLQPLRNLHEERKWRLSRNLQGRFESGAEPSSKLFRRQEDTDEMMDKLLHIKRYHAPL